MNSPQVDWRRAILLMCQRSKRSLSRLKVTARCIPLEGDAEFDDDDGGGTCIFTGQPSQRRGLFAKAY